MKRKLAAILLLAVALIGQAVASVLPPAWAPLEKDTAIAMPMDCMDMPGMDMPGMEMPSGKYAAQESGTAGTDGCGCCPNPGSACAVGGCSVSILPPSPLESLASLLPLAGAPALSNPIPPVPLSQLFRPPIA
ncbi:hypothetical protein [Microbulbifer marinus]|uniref:hypothetical protein n=1 Tax=Microbulbifer marinus TaxID=658218 RepID=UPI000B881E39|nr:hypothetical protein [Microbulbifer marinus]